VSWLGGGDVVNPPNCKSVLSWGEVCDGGVNDTELPVAPKARIEGYQ
jgi:hypothetical protein